MRTSCKLAQFEIKTEDVSARIMDWLAPFIDLENSEISMILEAWMQKD